jgi:predicted negative regulator of RcsB-dependent stress response
VKVYATEDEQVQALLNWFKRNGRSLAIILIMLISLIVGWQYWQVSSEKSLALASELYEKLQNATEQEQRDVLAKELATNHKTSMYGKIAALILTNQKANAQKWSEVESEYKWLYENTATWPDLQVVIFENWLRAKLELQQLEQANIEITKAEEKLNFAKLYPLNFYNLKGDILAKLNENTKAIDAYNKAIESANLNPESQQQTTQFVNWVILKRNDLLEPKPLA